MRQDALPSIPCLYGRRHDIHELVATDAVVIRHPILDILAIESASFSKTFALLQDTGIGFACVCEHLPLGEGNVQQEFARARLRQTDLGPFPVVKYVRCLMNHPIGERISVLEIGHGNVEPRLFTEPDERHRPIIEPRQP